MQFPSGRWGFVGSLPITLGSERAPTTADVLGCRTYTNEAGETVAPHFPTFETEAQARAHAAACNVTIAN
jgi:hypothetical protein